MAKFSFTVLISRPRPRRSDERGDVLVAIDREGNVPLVVSVVVVDADADSVRSAVRISVVAVPVAHARRRLRTPRRPPVVGISRRGEWRERPPDVCDDDENDDDYCCYDGRPDGRSRGRRESSDSRTRRRYYDVAVAVTVTVTVVVVFVLSVVGAVIPAVTVAKSLSRYDSDHPRDVDTAVPFFVAVVVIANDGYDDDVPFPRYRFGAVDRGTVVVLNAWCA